MNNTTHKKYNGVTIAAFIKSLFSTILLCSTVQPLFSQAVTPTPDTTPPTTDDEIVQLSRFTVTAAKDEDGYQAKDTLAGTRIRTELKDVGSAISVVTAKFLQDTGSKKSEDLLVYTTNTEVGGLGGNFTGAGNGPYLDTANARLTPQNNTRVRGLASADNTRDFFITDIPWDGYIVGRVDLQRGPNSILFGLGSPAGIINSSINQAAFKDSNTVEGRFGSYGSMRGSADFNKVLLKDELSLRASALYDYTQYQQEPAYNRDERYYLAARYDPKFLRFDSIGARTSLRINYEHGNISANRPRTTPPIDAITPWFTSMNKQTFDPRTVGTSDQNTVRAAIAAGDHSVGATLEKFDDGTPNPNFQPWLGSAGSIYENMVMSFNNPNSGSWSTLFPGTLDGSKNMPGGINSSGAIDNTITGIPYTVYRGIRNYNDYASFQHMDNYLLGVYKAKTLSDPSIFDFYNKLIDGPNKHEWQNFKAANIALTQTFFKDRLGLEAVYDWQKYGEGMDNILSSWSQALTVDVNAYLTDGSPNPNVGRPMVVGSNYGNFSRNTERKSARLTAYGELNFKDIMDQNSWLTRILGRHVFTGLYNWTQNDQSTRSWYNYATDSAFGNTIGFSDITTNQRLLATVNYLGPSLIKTTSASGANIGALNAVQVPTSGVGRYFNTTWKAVSVDPSAPYTQADGKVTTQSENPDNYIGWTNTPIGIWNANTGDINNLYYGGAMSRDKIESEAFVWQGFLLDGVIVPTVGLRHDTLKSYQIQASTDNVMDPNTKIVNFNDPRWSLPDQPYHTESGNSTSWSLVVHTPKWIAQKMPGRTNLSFFYNRSSNFQPAGSRVDIEGDPIASPKGNTREIGFVINTLNDRMTLKINWYKTTITNATLDGINSDYMIGAAEAWGYMYAMQAKNLFGSFADYASTGGYQKSDPNMTDAEAKAHAEAAINAFLSNPPPEKFMKAWHFADQLNNWQGWIQSTSPAGMTVTGDTMSKGVEIELTAKPIKNLDITFNVSKTTAQRTNMAGSFAKWVEDRWAFYQTVAGDVQLWGPWAGMETVRSKFEQEFYSGYRLYRMQEGGDVPELRPWHFNVVANYYCDRGWVKGLNVGAGYRWQDKVVVGYPVKNEDFDLSHPYYGPTEEAVDLWAGYEFKFAKKINCRVQFNIRNLGQKAHLVPVTVEPDGSPASCRIAEGMIWSLTTTFTF